ncbi:hypothetical protein BDF14DRAFT_1761662 [Spinellus fusiger]|nr:hypothetical protein BDF14DRAFT_1761662 [Spinellus fusiger]
MSESKQTIFPKAINIFRPTSSILQLKTSFLSRLGRKDGATSASPPSSTVSSASISSTNSSHSIRVPPTALSPTCFQSKFSLFQSSTPWSHYTQKNLSSVSSSVSQKMLQRKRSFSGFSRFSFSSSVGYDHQESDVSTVDSVETSDSYDMSDTESTEKHNSDNVISSIRYNALMEYACNSTTKRRESLSIVDEARMHRKIADLEIENASLIALNKVLEVTVRRQSLQIGDLQKRYLL